MTAHVHHSESSGAEAEPAANGPASRPPPLEPGEVLGLERNQLPRHIAIIMDGNGRWATKHGAPRIHGHVAGTESVREIVTHCARLGIEVLTLFGFSIENWKRPQDEVNRLMDLYAEYLVKERETIMNNDVRLVQIGRRAALPDAVLRELDETVRMSRNNRGLTFALAINYGGRTELADAMRSIAADVAAGKINPDDVDEAMIDSRLYTAGLPDPDLLIRTAGEMRVSNFLLWQISYAELYVTDVLWPEFRVEHLEQAIRAYAARERRFGGVGPSASPGS